MLGTLGVVYGDIGTSPLYALRICFSGSRLLQPTADNVLGVLSLIFWSLVVIISIKYMLFVMRADNEGEGGILALMALAVRGSSRRRLILALGLFGAALLYGDGMITPAISVLSAVEGLSIETSFFEPYVIPLSIAILVSLFLFQRRGTARIAMVFGPLMLIWFLALGGLGIIQIFYEPAVLLAANPLYGVEFFVHNNGLAFIVLGAVFLVVTGGEALYADMGHFGLRPIKLAWFSLVLPCLLFNYFGQGALLMRDPEMARNPFFLLAPKWALYPLVFLATAAAVIASQAVISGIFSLARQAVGLGFSPRLEIVHTSEEERGQIYIPAINWALMISVIALVVSFRSSNNLAGAYGIAVTSTMVLTTVLACIVARERWKWHWLSAFAVAGPFLAIDLAFFDANVRKIGNGGWLPLLVAAVIYTLMATWKQGRELLSARLQENALPIESFISLAFVTTRKRIPGTAVFMTGNPRGTPPALLHSSQHFKVLHERIVLLTVIVEDIPRVPKERRVEITNLDNGFYRVKAYFGFKERPRIDQVFRRCRHEGLKLRMADTTFFLGREALVPHNTLEMARWRKLLFDRMARNAGKATDLFGLPSGRVVEIGVQVRL